MPAESHTQIANFIWSICNLLRGPYKRNEYRKVILPLTVLRRFDCMLAVPMEKSLGNKRRRIGDPDDKPKDPDHIGEITRIFGGFRDGETRVFKEKHPITKGLVDRERVVSKVFDNEDFGYHKITVERPLRLNFQASAERIARLDEHTTFKNLASSKKKDPEKRQAEIEAGRLRQDEIRAFLRTLGDELWQDREAFLNHLRKSAKSADVRLSAPELKAVLAALGERDETAGICAKRDGSPEPDTDLRDTEMVPLKESIHEYFKREVLPHVPDAWIDEEKTKIGYEIPLNRHFYQYEPPRELEVISADIRALEADILKLLKEVTA